MSYSTVTLTGTYQLPDGTPASGTVEVIPSERLILDDAGNVVLSGRAKAKLEERTWPKVDPDTGEPVLDADGNPVLERGGWFSVALPATDDPRLTPTGFGYTLAARLHHTHLPAVSFPLPAATPTVDVTDVTQVDPSTFTPDVNYVTTADVNAVVATQVAPLDTRVGTVEAALPGKADDAEVAALDTRVDTAEGTLATLPDTYVPGDLTGVADGDGLVYDAALGKYVPGAAGDEGLAARVTTLEDNSVTVDETGADTIVISGDISATRTQAVYVAPFPSRLTQVGMSFAAAVTASDTNYWTVTIKRYRAGVAGTIATKTSKLVASGGEGIAAFTEWNFDNVTFANDTLAKGDIVAVTFTPTGTPAALSNTCVTFRAPSSDNGVPEPTAVLTDTFTRANAATLGTADTGQTWTSGTWTIASNAAVATATGVAYVETGQANCTIDAKVVSHGSSSVGIVFRYSDASNYWGVTNTGLFKRVAGAVTNMPTLSSAIVAGDSERVVLNGNSIEVYRQAGSAGSWVLVGSATDSFNATATMHGLRASGSNGSIDDYEVSVA